MRRPPSDGWAMNIMSSNSRFSATSVATPHTIGAINTRSHAFATRQLDLRAHLAIVAVQTRRVQRVTTARGVACGNGLLACAHTLGEGRTALIGPSMIVLDHVDAGLERRRCTCEPSLQASNRSASVRCRSADARMRRYAGAFRRCPDSAHPTHERAPPALRHRSARRRAAANELPNSMFINWPASSPTVSALSARRAVQVPSVFAAPRPRARPSCRVRASR